jgi:hypothetical protein
MEGTHKIVETAIQKAKPSDDLSLTPFQVLFCNIQEGSSNIMKGVISLARIFLQYGQDPNTDIFVTPPKPGPTRSADLGKITCKPLHAASFDLARDLLSHGVDVNALNSLSQTPLDATISYFTTFESYGFALEWLSPQPSTPPPPSPILPYPNGDELSNRVLIFLCHGARFNSYSRD